MYLLCMEKISHTIHFYKLSTIFIPSILEREYKKMFGTVKLNSLHLDVKKNRSYIFFICFIRCHV